MSLMKTLAKVAVGVALAKGAGAVMNNRTGGAASGGGLGGLLGDLAGSAKGSGTAGGGLQDALGGLMGGSGGLGGLGGLLEGLGGSGGGAQGGLQDMLSGLAGGSGLGGLLGGLSAATAKRPADNGANFGQVLNSAFDQTPEPEIEPTPDQEAAAALMLRAMIQAAKSDGKLDDAEQQSLVDQLGGDVDSEESAFVRAEMAGPVDVDALVAEVPRGMGAQVYAVSLLGIDLDTQPEAQYLHALAKGLGLDAKEVNGIHTQLGVPSLYV